MKKRLLNIITIIFVALGIILPNGVLAQTKWDTTRNSYADTTKGIKINYDKENYKITYTIPEDFKGEEIYFNIVKDLQIILEGLYVPGDSAPFTIEVINNSKYRYHYLENSLTIDTLEFNSEFENDYANDGDNVWYSFDIVNGSYGKYIKGSKAFDGEIIPAYYSINRTSNAAIMNLIMTSENYKRVKVGRMWKQVYYYTDTEFCKLASNADSRHEACKEILTDEVIGKELVARGYNGIEELDKYYLDFYNNYFGTNATTLEDLSDRAIYGKSSDKDGIYYYGGILDGERYNLRETNATVNALGYNWFYNECLYIAPNYDADGNIISEDDTISGKYSIGEYMRRENDVFENVFRKDLATVSGTSTLTPFQMYIDFNKTVNSHMSMNFGFMMSFKLVADKGNLVVNYVDTDGNKLTDEITSTGVVGDGYVTEEKTFERYKLIDVDGETVGEYINGTIYVTYIYDYVRGNLVVNYVDSDGNKLTDEITSTGVVGNEYVTEKKEFEGYTFISVDGEVSGEYIDGTIYVTYYYDKNLGTGDIEPPQTGVNFGRISTSQIEIVLYRKEEE